MIFSQDTLQRVPPRIWVKKFCLAREEKVRNNVPLYQLQMTKPEYQELEDSLRQSRQFQHNTVLTKEWCGAFTLYCAEWFRREYTHNWSWDPIFERLKFKLSPSEISEAVPLGLEVFWGRNIARYKHSNRNDYLGSLFKEGGLPSNLLSQADNSYQTAFSSIFDKYHLVSEFGDDAINNYIRNKLTYLPEFLKSDESIALLRSMVERLEGLVFRFSLENQADPVSHLEEHFPKWREAFPLPLESEIGTRFLGRLLSRATEEVKKVTRKRKELSCQHFADFVNQCFRSEVFLPVICQFNVNKLQLSSSRIELAIFEGDKHLASLGTCFAQFDSEKISVRIRQKMVSVVRRDTDSELYLVAMQCGSQLDRVIILGSSVDLVNTPLTLIEKDDRWRLVGKASARTQSKHALVLVPVSAVVEPIIGYAEISKNLQFQSLLSYEISGKAAVTLDSQDRFVITTGEETFSNDLLYLKGNQLQWKSTPPLTYKGVPEVKTPDDEVGFGLRMYLNGELAHNLPPSEKHGRQLVTVKNADNEVLLRKRIGILPADFDLELIGGVLPNKGIVRITTLSPCIVQVKKEGILSKVRKLESSITEVNVESMSNPPATLDLTVQASLLSQPITIEIPFPSVGVTAYDKDNNPLRDTLALDDLLGSRIYMFAQQGNPARYEIRLTDMTLRGETRKSAQYKWSYLVVDKPVEVSLYGLKDYVLDLLSLHENLDGKVELTIMGV